MGLSEFRHDAEELLDVLNASERFIGTLGLVGLDEARFLDDALYHPAQVP